MIYIQKNVPFASTKVLSDMCFSSAGFEIKEHVQKPEVANSLPAPPQMPLPEIPQQWLVSVNWGISICIWENVFVISASRNGYKGKEPVGPGMWLFLTAPIWLRELCSTCRKEDKKPPLAWIKCGIPDFVHFQDYSGTSLSNLILTLEVTQSCGDLDVAHGSQPVL